MKLGFNLANKLAQTQLSPARSLLPLFEAVANSLNSIDEGKIQKPKIVISIERDTKQLPLTSEVVPNQPVTGFVIEDNGVGFTDENLESFKEAYSSKKRAYGGKGIGRITWLKAFERADVDSVFEDGKSNKRRTFTFSLNSESDKDPKATKSTDARKTVVRLVNYLPEYKCPSGFDTIARRIIAHFMEAFVIDSCPEIWLKDEYEKNEVLLNRYFTKSLRLGSKTSGFRVGGKKYKIEHVQLMALPDTHHEIHYCAASRSVATQNVTELIPGLPGHLTHTSGKNFVYVATVTGELLESKVDETRGRFDIADEGTLFATGGEVWQAITKKVTEKASEFLAEYLKPLRDHNKERIRRYVQTKEPKYRPLLKHKPEWLDKISPNLTDDELELELYKLSRDYDVELRVNRPRVKSSADTTEATIQARKRRLNAYLQEWNEQGIAKLADYVVHRKATLQFLRDSLELLKSGDYAAEDQIHNIICPMRTTSDDVAAEQMNLWIIDERLGYHSYLASDKRMDNITPLKTKSAQRPDLILFNAALSFTDAYRSIAIVEFKRSMRDDYDPKENPVQQIYDYVSTLRDEEATDRKGRPMPKLGNVPIYAYIICDVTKSLKKTLKDHDFVEAADGQSYYKFKDGHKVYIEVISFDKMLQDSEKRNQLFFDKLNIDSGAGGAAASA